MGEQRLRMLMVRPRLRGLTHRLASPLYRGPLLLVFSGSGEVERLKVGGRVLMLLDKGHGLYRLEDGRLKLATPLPLGLES